jgi:hypothetical protein
MNVVIHEAISPYGDAPDMTPFEKKSQVIGFVFIREEYLLTAVTPLDKMMRNSAIDGSGGSGHLCTF